MARTSLLSALPQVFVDAGVGQVQVVLAARCQTRNVIAGWAARAHGHVATVNRSNASGIVA